MDFAALQTLEYPKIVERLTDVASTALGKELAAALLPTDDPAEACRRVDETAEGAAVLDAVGLPPLGGARDIRALVKKAEKSVMLETHELLAIGSSLYAARNVKRFFKELPAAAPTLIEAASLLEPCGKLEKGVETAVDEHGALRDDASGELVHIRREIRASQSRVKERLDAILRAQEYQKFFQDTLVTMRGDRYVVPIKQEYRQFFPGIVHDQSASGATLFIEPMEIVQLNNDIKQLYLHEKQEIERILRTLTADVAAQAAPLRDNCRILAQIDFVFAKARLAAQMHATRPLLDADGRIELKAARHPLIDETQVVPVDIILGDAYSTLLITGPNTGGKTVSMKTLGLLALMAQSGFYIPAATARLPVFANVFADIGDEQSIEQSLSTFSAHMTHIVAILQQVGSRDLLLLDELGAGTDPEEGAALAMAVLEHLLRVGALVVATTHYSQLKTFAYTQEGIENASVEFDVETLRPTYRLLTGVPGASNAFAISRRLGLGEALIERAKALIDADHAQFERVLSGLELEKTRYERKNAEIAERECQAAALERQARALRDEVFGKKEKIISRAQEQSANLVREARREAEQVIRELKAQFSDQGAQKRQETIDVARRTLSGRLQSIEAAQSRKTVPEKPVDPAALRPGDAVYVTALGQKGIVLSVQGGGDILVQFGLIKTTVPASQCRAAEPASASMRRGAPSAQKAKEMNLSKAQTASRQIDIRGMLVDEAEGVVAKFIDDALLAGLGQVLVIHGKGTGALRKGIRSYLKGHRSVQDISVGEFNEGGDGATVVQLR